MKENKSFWDEVGDFFRSIINIFIVWPIMILIIVGMLLYQLFFSSSIAKKYENNSNVILTSKFKNTIYEYAESTYNKEVFSEVKKGDSVLGGLRATVDYTFKSNDMIAEGYNRFVKDEIINMYYKIQGKTIEKDQIFANTDTAYVELRFYINNSSGKKVELCCPTFFYQKDKGFLESRFNTLMTTDYVTSEKLEKLLNESN